MVDTPTFDPYLHDKVGWSYKFIYVSVKVFDLLLYSMTPHPRAGGGYAPPPVANSVSQSERERGREAAGRLQPVGTYIHTGHTGTYRQSVPTQTETQYNTQ